METLPATVPARRSWVARLFAADRRTSPQQLNGGTMIPIGPSVAGVRLNDWRDTLTIPAVWRCVNVVTDAVAMLPWQVMKRGEDGQGEPQPGHPANWLLHHQASGEMSAFSFRKAILSHAMLQGNGYAEIQRDQRNRPTALWLIDDPDRVTPGRRASGEIAYAVQQRDGGRVIVPSADMLHFRGLATDGIVGIGILEVARRSLVVSKALDLVTERYFAQGMRTPGFVKMKGPKGLEAFANLVRLIKEQFTGLSNFHTPIPLDADMDFVPAGSNLKDSEFIDMRKFSVLDVCRWFGVPPHLVYDLERATFSNIESQDRTFLTYGLLPRIVPMEQEVDAKLLTSNWGGLYSKMNVNAFQRGDSAARASFYQQMRNMGVFTVNDILRLEDMPTIGPEGDVRVMQVQYQPTGATPDAAPDEPNDPDAPPPPPAAAKLNGAHH